MAENETTDTKKMNAAMKKAETEAKTKAVEAAAEAAENAKTEVSDPVLTQVLQRLDNLEGSNERLEADNKKLKAENEKLTESLKENAELKNRLEAMDKQIKSINVAENMSEEERRQAYVAQREKRAEQIRQPATKQFHLHTASGAPITDDSIKAERKAAGKDVVEETEE